MDAYSLERKNLVDKLKKIGYIKSKKIERTFLSIKREHFVPKKYKKFSYNDEPIPIGENQTISAPHMVAIMTELLNVKKDHKVLEIGTGSGYQAAILSSLAKEVISLERIEKLVINSRNNLKKARIKNVSVFHENGTISDNKHGPFERILVTAAPLKIPRSLKNQLKEGGKLVIPLGDHNDQELFQFEKKSEELIGKKYFPVRFVPLKEGLD